MIQIGIGVTALATLLLGILWRRGLFTEPAKRKEAEKRLLTTFHNLPIGAVMFDLTNREDPWENEWYLSNDRFIEDRIESVVIASRSAPDDWFSDVPHPQTAVTASAKQKIGNIELLEIIVSPPIHSITRLAGPCST